MKLPEGWKEVKLEDVIECVENGNRPKGGVGSLKEGIPSIGGEHINKNGCYKFSNIKFISKDFFNNQKRGIIKQGDVLVVKDGATTGRVALVSKEKFPYSKALVNEHVFILRPKKSIIDSKFLFYCLYSSEGQKKILYNFHGSAQGGINTQFVKNVVLPLPPLSIQQKTVSILEKVEQSKEWRKESDDLTKEFLKAVFMEMFGDPIINNKKYSLIQLRNVIEVRGRVGWKGYQKTDLRDSGPYVIGATHISSSGYLDLTDPVYISREKFDESPEIVVKKDDLIFVQRGNTIGKTGFISENIGEATINPCVLILRPLKINPYYLNHLFNLPKMKKKLWTLNCSSAQPMITQQDIKKFEIPFPPMELQKKFASIVKEIEVMRGKQKHSKEHLDNLFNVLMQKAFNGELV